MILIHLGIADKALLKRWRALLWESYNTATETEAYIKGSSLFLSLNRVRITNSIDFFNVIIPTVEDIKTEDDRTGAPKDIEEFCKVGSRYLHFSCTYH